MYSKKNSKVTCLGSLLLSRVILSSSFNVLILLIVSLLLSGCFHSNNNDNDSSNDSSGEYNFYTPEYYGVASGAKVTKKAPDDVSTGLYLIKAAEFYDYISNRRSTDRVKSDEIGKGYSVAVLGSGVSKHDYDLTNLDTSGSRNYGFTPYTSTVTHARALAVNGLKLASNGNLASKLSTTDTAREIREAMQEVYYTEGYFGRYSGKTDSDKYVSPGDQKTAFECGAKSSSCEELDNKVKRTKQAHYLGKLSSGNKYDPDRGFSYGSGDLGYGTSMASIIAGDWNDKGMHGVSRAKILSVKTSFTESNGENKSGSTNKFFTNFDVSGKQFAAALKWTVVDKSDVPIATLVNTDLVAVNLYNNLQMLVGYGSLGYKSAISNPVPFAPLNYDGTKYVSMTENMSDANSKSSYSVSSKDTRRYGFDPVNIGQIRDGDLKHERGEQAYKQVRKLLTDTSTESLIVLSSFIATHINMAYDAAKDYSNNTRNNTILVSGVVKNTSDKYKLYVESAERKLTVAKRDQTSSKTFAGCSSFGAPVPKITIDGKTYANCIMAPAKTKDGFGNTVADSATTYTSRGAAFNSGKMVSGAFVAGAVAALKKAFPSLSHLEIRDKMLVTANREDDNFEEEYEGGGNNTFADELYGAGMLDLYKAANPSGTLSVASGNTVQSSGADYTQTNLLSSKSMQGFANSQKLQNLLSKAIFFDQYGFYYTAKLDKYMQHSFEPSSILENQLDFSRGMQTKEVNHKMFGTNLSFSINTTSDTKNQDVIQQIIDKYEIKESSKRQEDDQVYFGHFQASHSIVGDKVQANFAVNSTAVDLFSEKNADLQSLSLLSSNSFNTENNYSSFVRGFNYNNNGMSSSISGSQKPISFALNAKLTDSISSSLSYKSSGYGTMFSSSSDIQNKTYLIEHQTMFLFKKTQFGLSYGLLNETGAFLGTAATGALAMGKSSRTLFSTANLRINLSSRFSLVGGYVIGYSNIKNNNLSVFRKFSNVVSRAFRLGFIANSEDLSAQYGFAMSVPMKVIAGIVEVDVPVSRNKNKEVQREKETVSLASEGQEKNYELFYKKSLGKDAQINLNYLHKTERNHKKDVPNENIMMIKMKTSY